MQSDPLQNPRWERYCRERATGKSQRQAMLAAYPRRVAWSEKAVDDAACKLESKPEVKRRLGALKDEAARAAVITRTEVLNGMAETFAKAREANARQITQVGVQAVSAIGRTLLDELPRDGGADGPAPFVRDYATLLAPPHLAMHRAVARDEGCDAWMPGGRMSGKSSAISLEIVGGLMAHPDRSAIVFLKVGRYIREGVYEQLLWALDALGVADEWDCTVSPPRMVRRATGQAVVFRGCDKAEKTKAIKAPAGTYYAYQWWEETDQFSGMAEIRNLRQSVTRGPEGAPFFRFESFNPPRSKASWTMAEQRRRELAGEPVWGSTYLDMPPEWLPEAAVADAEALREADEESWRHEYLGEPVGFGAEVFPRAEVREPSEAELRAVDHHLYGVDWGFASDPFVWLHLGYVRATRTLYVLEELVCRGETNAETAARVLALMSIPRWDEGWDPVDPARTDSARANAPHLLWDAAPHATVMCDSAEPKSVEDFRQAGIRADGAPKQGAFSVRSGVRWLQQRASIVISPSCALAAHELASYQYETTADGEVTGRLPDRDNHAIDAMRYACSTLIADRQNV